MKLSNEFTQAIVSFCKARYARLAAQPMFENAMKQAPDEAMLAIRKYVLCLHDQLVAFGCLAKHVIEHSRNESVINEVRKVIDDVAPQTADDKRKAQLAWIRRTKCGYDSKGSRVRIVILDEE